MNVRNYTLLSYINLIVILKWSLHIVSKILKYRKIWTILLFIFGRLLLKKESLYIEFELKGIKGTINL